MRRLTLNDRVNIRGILWRWRHKANFYSGFLVHLPMRDTLRITYAVTGKHLGTLL